MLEKQNLIALSKTAAEGCDKDELVAVDEEEEVETESESDNEEIVVVEPEAVKKSDDVNLDDEFEKIVPFKFRKLSEESIDEVDHEIAEILSDAKPLETELAEASEKENSQEPDSESSEGRVSVKAVESVSSAPAPVTFVEHKPQPISDDVEAQPIEENIKESPLHLIFDEQRLPREASPEKPPVPIPTYRWEDLKRAKEQVSGDDVCTSICSSHPRLVELSPIQRQSSLNCSH